ncbi:hypothetical protein OAM67_01165 [bacterium]|nr:hypothetical protein [bacterium]
MSNERYNVSVDGVRSGTCVDEGAGSASCVDEGAEVAMFIK